MLRVGVRLLLLVLIITVLGNRPLARLAGFHSSTYRLTPSRYVPIALQYRTELRKIVEAKDHGPSPSPGSCCSLEVAEQIPCSAPEPFLPENARRRCLHTLMSLQI
jgi:hypothetical protein